MAVVNGVVALSTGVMTWWDGASDPDRRSLPDPVRSALESRRSVGDADVHVVLWFVAAALLVFALGRRPWRVMVAALGGLWAYAAVLEFCQRWVDARTPSWLDLIGNTIGLAAGALAAGVWLWLRRPSLPTSPMLDVVREPAAH